MPSLAAKVMWTTSSMSCWSPVIRPQTVVKGWIRQNGSMTATRQRGVRCYATTPSSPPVTPIFHRQTRLPAINNGCYRPISVSTTEDTSHHSHGRGQTSPLSPYSDQRRWLTVSKVHCQGSQSPPSKVTSDTTNPVLLPLLDKPTPQNAAIAFSLKPYLALSRMDKPIGTWLLFWPCAWSITLASHTLGVTTLSTPLFYTTLFGVGAIVMRGAGCTINDMWDAKMDRMVERTKSRPLASGQLTHSQALGFLSVQLSAGLAVLVQLDLNSILLGASSLCLVILYPLMKRITYWPQLVLGMAFNWGALLGWSAVAVVPSAIQWSVVLPLYLGSVFWTLIYDTIYAHQDKLDDVHAGVKSTALLFGQHTKSVLSGVSLVTIGSYTYAASNAIIPSSLAISNLDAIVSFLSLGSLSLTDSLIPSILHHHPAFSFALVAASFHLAWQIRLVQLDNRLDCWKKFCSNKGFGWIVFSGLLADYLLWLYLEQQLPDNCDDADQQDGTAAVTPVEPKLTN